jgi:hypothetical protein
VGHLAMRPVGHYTHLLLLLIPMVWSQCVHVVTQRVFQTVMPSTRIAVPSTPITTTACPACTPTPNLVPIPVILTKPTTLTRTKIQTVIRTVTPSLPPTQIISRFQKIMSDLSPTCIVTDCSCPYPVDNPNGDILPAHVCCR